MATPASRKQVSKAFKQLICEADVTLYVEKTSDFAFEMSVRQSLISSGFECSHAGTYRDPVTDKIRAYDFRAAKYFSNKHCIHIAVECKNIKPHAPLLIYATQRRQQEAHHDLLLFEKEHGHIFVSTERKEGSASIYKPGEYVGRATDQVSKNGDGEFRSPSDAESYEKVLQALHSTNDLVRSSASVGYVTSKRAAIFPFLVIPDGMLWQVDYNDEGVQHGTPRNVSRGTLYYDHRWTASGPMGSAVMYTISHLEIITLGHLANRINELEGAGALFPE